MEEWVSALHCSIQLFKYSTIELLTTTSNLPVDNFEYYYDSFIGLVQWWAIKTAALD